MCKQVHRLINPRPEGYGSLHSFINPRPEGYGSCLVVHSLTLGTKGYGSPFVVRSFTRSFILFTALQRAALTSSRQVRYEQAKHVDGLQSDSWILLKCFLSRVMAGSP